MNLIRHMGWSLPLGCLMACQTLPPDTFQPTFPFEMHGDMTVQWQHHRAHLRFTSVVAQSWQWLGIGLSGGPVSIVLAWRRDAPQHAVTVVQQSLKYVSSSKHVLLVGKRISAEELSQLFGLYRGPYQAQNGLEKIGFRVVGTERKNGLCRLWRIRASPYEVVMNVKRHRILTASEYAEIWNRWQEKIQKFPVREVSLIDLNLAL